LTTGSWTSKALIARSGIIALGTAVSGQPLQSDESSISVDEQIELLACSAAPSREQIETHATSSHTKLTGSKQAMSFLGKTRAKNILSNHTCST